jgi:hypothetical protein
VVLVAGMVPVGPGFCTVDVGVDVRVDVAVVVCVGT